MNNHVIQVRLAASIYIDNTLMSEDEARDRARELCKQTVALRILGTAYYADVEIVPDSPVLARALETYTVVYKTYEGITAGYVVKFQHVQALNSDHARRIVASNPNFEVSVVILGKITDLECF